MTADADAGGDTDAGVTVRVAREDEVSAVRRRLDAAMLTVPSDLAERVADGDALVALDGSAAADDRGGDDGDDDRDDGADRNVVGALVLDGDRIDSVAVRKSRRAEGVGRALVAAATARADAPLTATFRRQVRPFYESLGFEVGEREDDTERLQGRLDGE